MYGIFKRGLQSWIPQSVQYRQALKLAGGSAGSQAILLAGSPILTRLYGPASFGVLAAFAALLSLLNVVSSLRYELAIAVPERDEESEQLVELCGILLLFTAFILIFFIWLLGDFLIGWLRMPSLGPCLWLLPPSVLLIGWYQVLSYWSIRQKQFGFLSRSRLLQSVFGLCVNLCTFSFGVFGLIAGQVLGQGFGSLFYLFNSRLPRLCKKSRSPNELFSVLNKYRGFALYSSPAGLVNVVGNQLPFLIFLSVYGAAEIGELTLAYRLLVFPAALVGGSVGQVVLSQAATLYRAGKLNVTLKRIANKLLHYGLIMALLISGLLAPLATQIFGQEWGSLHWMIPLMIPVFMGQLIVSSLSTAVIAAGKNSSEFAGQLILTLFRLTPFLILFIPNVSFFATVATWSISAMIGYIFYWRLVCRSIQDKVELCTL